MKFKDKDGETYQDIKEAKRVFCYARWQQSACYGVCDECPVSCANNGTDYGCDTFTENHPAAAARLMGYEVIEDEPNTDGGNLPHICEKCVWEYHTERCAECKNNDKFTLCNPADCGETPDTCFNWGLADCALCMDKDNFDPVSKTDKEASMDKLLKDWTLGEVKEYCRKMHGDACYCEDVRNDCLLIRCNLCCNEPLDMDLTDPPRFTEEEAEDAAPESLPQGCHPDPPGMKGPPCGCPVCGRIESIEWDGETDVSRCTHCGWNHGAFTSKIKEASMDKPLKDWTLGETQRECALHRRGGSDICEGCAFDFNECPFSKDWPEEWELEKPRFTEEEVADARAIMRLFPSAWQSIGRDEDGTLVIEDGDGWEAIMASSLFPSILPGQTVKLLDIIGDGA